MELIVRLFKTLWHIYWEFEIIVSSFSVLFYSYRGSPSLFWTYYFPPLFPVLTPEIWICGKVNMNRKNKREMLKCWTLYVFDYFLGGELKLLCSSLSALASEVWMWRKPEHMAIHRIFRFFRLHGATRPRQEHKSKTSRRNGASQGRQCHLSQHGNKCWDQKFIYRNLTVYRIIAFGDFHFCYHHHPILTFFFPRNVPVHWNNFVSRVQSLYLTLASPHGRDMDVKKRILSPYSGNKS